MRFLATVGFAIFATLSARPAEAQVPQPIARSPGQLVVATDPVAQIAALRQQVVALQAAIQVLQVKTQFVTIVGSDYALNVPGNITIRAGGPVSNIQISANNNLEVKTGANTDIRSGATASFWAGGAATLRGDAGMAILGSTVQINRNGSPAAIVGSAISPAASSAPARVVTGSSTVLIGN